MGLQERRDRTIRNHINRMESHEERMEKALICPPVTIYVEAPSADKVRDGMADLIYPSLQRNNKVVMQVGDDGTARRITSIIR
jgi:hypothetical protein